MIAFLAIIENVDTRSKLEKIFIKYNKHMYYIAYSILGNVYDAQDVVQTSILKLNKYIDRVGDLESAKTKNFISTIVKNTAIDYYRQRKNTVDIDEFRDILQDDSVNLDDIVIRMSEAKWLSEKLCEINERYAEIIKLKYYYQLTETEISSILNISKENTYTRLHRAKAEVKKLVLRERKGDELSYEYQSY